MSENDTATFASLGLRESIVTMLGELGYEAPTPIQQRTIPVMLEGRDLIGQAQTGTGKTAAFSLPMLQKIDTNEATVQALILTPTRELAMQVAEAIHKYSRAIGQISVLPVYGGAPMYLQIKRLERGAHIVVGTPGRLIDHLTRETLDLSSLRLLVLDEADEMLKMGFQEDVERIISSTPDARQIALFSATMPAEVRRIAQQYLSNPVRIEIEHKTMTAPLIEQRLINVAESQKMETLTRILELEPKDAVLVFRRTKNGAAELAEKLEARGFSAVAMHGDMTQSLREGVIRRVKAGQVEIVVATDVAARGLDVEQIAHVINYDVPHDVEAYVHRIGRTGRAGRTGTATIFVTPRERRMLREIERYTGSPIKPMRMPTQVDVATRRIETFKQSLRDSIALGDLDLYVEMVEALAEEGGHDITEVAAAAARMANSARSLDVTAASDREEQSARSFTPPPPSERAPKSRRTEPVESLPPRRPRAETADAPLVLQGTPPPPGEQANEWKPRRDATRTPSESKADSRPPRDEGDKVRLSIGVGSRDGIRPADIVGSIANEADIPGKDIGPIDIQEEVTYVGLPAHYAARVIERTARAKFRGRPLNVQMADDEPEGTFKRAREAYDRKGAPPARTPVPRRRDEGFPARKTFPSDAERPRTRGADEERPFGRKPPRASHSRDAAPRSFGGGDRASTPRPTSGRFRVSGPASRPERGERSFVPSRPTTSRSTRTEQSSDRPRARTAGPDTKKRSFTPRTEGGSSRGPGKFGGPKKFDGPKSFGKGPKKRR